MTIDPVILLAEDLRSTEAALRKAARLYSEEHRGEDGELVNLLLGRMKRLHNDIAETVPSSALGAAELVRMTARRLPFSYSRYAAHLHEIANRLSEGCKLHADLVWLRALKAATGENICGQHGGMVARWLDMAVLGAARPVMVFRSVQPVQGNPRWRTVLARDTERDLQEAPSR